MAVMEMKRIGIYARKSDRKRILELLQRKGVVEVHSPQEAEELFSKTDTTAARATFEKNAQLLLQSAAVLDKYAPPPRQLPQILRGRTPVTPQQVEETAKNAGQAAKAASQIAALEKRVIDGEAEVLRLQAQLEALRPWAGLDISMRTRETPCTSVFIGSFPEELDEAQLKNRLALALPETAEVEAEIISAQPQQTCVFLVCHKSCAVQVEGALRAMGFAYPAAPSRRSPAQRIAELEERMEKARQSAEQAKQDIAAFAPQRQDLLFTADYYAMRAEKYQVLGDLWQSPHVFCVLGYIPAEDAPGLQALLESQYRAFVEVEDPGPDEELPVKLKNGFFASPVESVVEGYSLPGKGEVDPSKVMCLFYYVLFGLMLSDAAYGLLTVIGCGIGLWKFKNMEPSIRRTLRMFLFCGISTTVWGVLFGSYFGDAIPVIAETFFHTQVTVPALWFEPLSDPMRLLIFSFAVGVAHLFTGLGVQFYQLFKRKQYADAIYDVVFWYLLIGGLIVVLLSTEIFQNIAELPFTVPGPVVAAAAVLAGVGAVGILFTAGRESRSPVKRFLKGLYGLYGVSSYLSDILSYSRLLALGLATSVISTVFNQLGAMLGGGVVGAVFFILIFLIGHAMNMAINLLGAYVHTNRLQFVEFFGKFYEGGGRKFQPFAANTKHFKIMEEK